MSRTNISSITTLVAGLAVLVFALLSVSFTSEPLLTIRLSDYYYNYSLGIVNRGLVGSILQYFHGPPTEEMIQAVIPPFSFYWKLLLVTIVWLLLFIPLIRRQLPTSLRWLLLAYMALLLLAPTWHYQAVKYVMDPYLFFCALFALICLLRNQPLLLVVPIAAGFLIHPLMLLFTTLLAVLAFHACMTQERFFVKWRQWGSAAGILVALLVLFVQFYDPQRNLELLSNYNYSYPEALAWLEKDFLYTIDHATRHIVGIWRTYTLFVVLVVVLYLVVPLGLFMLLARECAKEKCLRTTPLVHPIAQFPLVRWVVQHDIALLLAAAMLCFVTTVIVVVDFMRMLLLGFWCVTIVLAYLLWCVSNHAPTDEEEPVLATQGRNKFRYGLTGFILVLSYTFGGAPLIDLPVAYPERFSCKKYCIPWLTDNPLGRLYGATVLDNFTSSALPLSMDATTMRLVYWKYREHEIRDGLLLLPDIELDWIARASIVGGIDQKLRISLNYESATVPKILLGVSNKEGLNPAAVVTGSVANWLQEPDVVTRSFATWTITAIATGMIFIEVILAENGSLAVREFTIEDIS